MLDLWRLEEEGVRWGGGGVGVGAGEMLASLPAGSLEGF